MSELNEAKENKINALAERYYDKYTAQMDLLETSLLCKVKGGLLPFDAYALGKQLEQFEDYKAMCEEDGSTNLLGKLPNVAFDVLTVAYGTSIIPVIASVQPKQQWAA